ncbi:agmatine deiminase family protein [Pontibacter locisalis]|uniref:Agmatine deiminase family protein n=1 Tax=Pontibacter locisalis TaxID=1719035 RepID=A0ABW5ILL4_9BACT
MVIDKESNVVYFSDLIQTGNNYKNAFERVRPVLEKHQIDYRFLKETKDIWCRDYLPIQKGENNFVQFRYEPSYLKEELELQSDPSLVLPANNIKARFSGINLDGGNVIRWSDKVIMTSRIFAENTGADKNELLRELKDLLEVDVLLIPDIREDMTGHADGHLRFVDNKTVLVNQLNNEYKYWREGFLKMIRQAGLNYVEMPWFTHKDKLHKNTAIGSYVNYLEIGNLIIFPIFDLPGNLDTRAVETIKAVFPDRIIETVNINEIASEGGLLNCVSWTIKENNSNTSQQ